MILQSENIKTIQKLNYSENDIIKAFGKRKAKEFKEFYKNNSENFEIETDKLIKFAKAIIQDGADIDGRMHFSTFMNNMAKGKRF